MFDKDWRSTARRRAVSAVKRLTNYPRVHKRRYITIYLGLIPTTLPSLPRELEQSVRKSCAFPFHFPRFKSVKSVAATRITKNFQRLLTCTSFPFLFEYENWDLFHALTWVCRNFCFSKEWAALCFGGCDIMMPKNF